VEQAAKGSTLAAGVDMAKHPDQRRAVVRGKKRVICSVLVDDFGKVGSGNGGVRTCEGFRFRRFHVLPVALHMGR
jgi:hypothetical protein